MKVVAMTFVDICTGEHASELQKTEERRIAAVAWALGQAPMEVDFSKLEWLDDDERQEAYLRLPKVAIANPRQPEGESPPIPIQPALQYGYIEDGSGFSSVFAPFELTLFADAPAGEIVLARLGLSEDDVPYLYVASPDYDHGLVVPWASADAQLFLQVVEAVMYVSIGV